MADINLEAVAGKLNRIGYEAFFKALRHAKGAGNRNVELAHWLFHILQGERTDLALTADHFGLDRNKLLTHINVAITGFRKNETEMPTVSNTVMDLLDRGWHYATLFFGETQIRTGHVLVGAMQSRELDRAFKNLSPEFNKVSLDVLTGDYRKIWAASEEETLRPMDGSGIGETASAAQSGGGVKGTTPLDRFSQDLTARAKAGGMDPILGRDDEIRQLIDVLMRRRQNNPILTGEAGVGKTAVVEGFAQRIAAGEVPPPLKGVRLCALDVGLMQAGASMKGEFEQRLRSVIDEVQSAPSPIILFIDEAHTLIGAGGSAGTGDAANLLKPALARGTLRTIAATTWAEYRQYIEKDPALTRRFQPIQVDEPDVESCRVMLRGLLAPMEKHHGVRISEAAVTAAVNLSHRYIPARQLPDKAVSLLDTAAARVAISQSATPALIEDARAAIAAREAEKAALLSDGDLGGGDAGRIAAIDTETMSLKDGLGVLESEWATERALVEDIRSIRDILAEPRQGEDQAARRTELRSKFDALEAIVPEKRMIHPHVDEQAVASVVSDWTGIPVGRMVRDEIETVLKLPGILNRRVIGQSHGLAMIAKRIETSRARLDNPSKPIGVFMLAGPSGVGKTETALALAEALYGGEQNVITINMSEFQEAHTVSSLKGAPPGYVGYGEGGRLTEAVRRKPYSVILLDEVEKAHPDVHEIFFQVFDKGVMEDGNGRRIDFKNTLIILTTNVGTELIVELSREPKYRDDPEELSSKLRAELLQVFPPALLGRMVTIPYYPLSNSVLDGIVRLQLGRIDQRIRDAHGAAFIYDDAVVDHIVSKCNDPDSGGRMIDNVITNTLLPALSREFLKRSLAKEKITQARVTIEGGDFAYGWN
ncbi:MAG: type VI secretion system ATPase TssH [Bradyrhizobium sp.]|uniref:type VI secretion system ATPase TssH n=1 Tax=Bradyrhizobium sp. TaxID=376 RepID=UPI001D41A1A4|nr:type VI secretion system ATPase TssH [Bradyrhizobium sp.]MBV9566270.1 type VI secretion system ATPase TssH [Bradyrhizobium sp.]